jgi:hypothetical protein
MAGMMRAVAVVSAQREVELHSVERNQRCYVVPRYVVEMVYVVVEQGIR